MRFRAVLGRRRDGVARRGRGSEWCLPARIGESIEKGDAARPPTLKESHQEPAESPETPPEASAPDAGGEAQEATERPEERRGWFRRFFGL